MSLIKESITDVLTPVGNLAWVTIVGEGRKKLNSQVMEYSANIVLPEAEFNVFNDTIKAYYEANKPTTAHNFKPWKIVSCNADGTLNAPVNGVRDGTHRSLKFKTNVNIHYNGETKKYKVPVANSSGMGIELGDKLIGNGSKGLIQGKLGIYFVSQTKACGVMFMLGGIQLLNLVEYSAGGSKFSDMSAHGDFQGVDSGSGIPMGTAPVSGSVAAEASAAPAQSAPMEI